MKLTDLNPRWIHENILVMDCPCCKKVLLTCKNVPMPVSEQMEIFIEVFGEGNLHTIVPCSKDTAWKISGKEFENMTITPSLDASASGHWHGFITNGNIV